MRRFLALALVACGPPPRPVVVETPDQCAAALRELEIDVSPEPKICPALRAAIAPLRRHAREEVRGLRIIREGRGRCGDKCGDLAGTILSDATIAYYSINEHALHVVDATFEGPRWRGGDQPPVAVRAYLSALGLPTWEALVERVRKIPGVTLPARVPEGAGVVFDAIVRRGPSYMLGGDVSLEHLVRHELGHAVLLHPETQSDRISGWSSITGWKNDEGKPANGFDHGAFSNELPIVASRILLGLPRGEALYQPHGSFPTPYASFDPIEDNAEAFRLVHSDPEKLGEVSPARLFAASAGDVRLTGRLRRFIRPALEVMFRPPAQANYVMEAIRAHGEALLPEAAPFADPRPLDLPPELSEELRIAVVDSLVVRIGNLQFRPPDAVVKPYVDELLAYQRSMEAFERGLPTP